MRKPFQLLHHLNAKVSIKTLVHWKYLTEIWPELELPTTFYTRSKLAPGKGTFRVRLSWSHIIGQANMSCLFKEAEDSGCQIGRRWSLEGCPGRCVAGYQDLGRAPPPVRKYQHHGSSIVAHLAGQVGSWRGNHRCPYQGTKGDGEVEAIPVR